jgi:prepilin-type N-terminal cleavage/methylation domain-containing protein
MKWFKGREKGFTLVELLVAIPIIGLLGLAMGAVLMQLLRSDNISQRMVAVRQVQAAGDKVSVDALQAQYVSGVGEDMTSENWSLILSWSGGWTDTNTGDYITRKVTVEYYLEEASDGLCDLKRREWLNVPTTADATVDSTVAEHLDVSQMSCQWYGGGDRTFAFKVVSVVGTKMEERTYNITPRSVG